MPALPFQKPVLLLVKDKHGAALPPWRVAFWLVMLGSELRTFIPMLTRSIMSGERDPGITMMGRAHDGSWSVRRSVGQDVSAS